MYFQLRHELRGAEAPSLQALLAQLSPCDLVLVEGFKREPIPKLEIHRLANAKPLLFPEDPNIIAIASDAPIATSLPSFELTATDAIGLFILQSLGIR